MSNLKKCHADEPLAVPLNGLHFDDKLHFVEKPVEIVDREVKWLKRSRIPLVKVRWNSKRDVEEISSGSTTTHPDLSLPEYEAFYDDHVKEICSGSPTTPSDISLSEYDSFIFDLSINPFPPVDRSDSYELTDELIPFISAPEYDCFRFTDEPNSKDFTKDVVEPISPTKEPQVLTVLPTHPTL
uniref:Putative reverse transcriptase domain-containing protein n=1 Tax=Tanacetum cinerariifolium TaxID=118510 RepID=A0A6L2P553_TANCI|nr:putative reverse transcriptase domain-containing protein [Tanacetum cinerariifolium]